MELLEAACPRPRRPRARLAWAAAPEREGMSARSAAWAVRQVNLNCNRSSKQSHRLPNEEERITDSMSEGVSTLSELESKLARRQYLANTKFSELHIN